MDISQIFVFCKRKFCILCFDLYGYLCYGGIKVSPATGGSFHATGIGVMKKNKQTIKRISQKNMKYLWLSVSLSSSLHAPKLSCMSQATSFLWILWQLVVSGR